MLSEVSFGMLDRDSSNRRRGRWGLKQILLQIQAAVYFRTEGGIDTETEGCNRGLRCPWYARRLGTVNRLTISAVSWVVPARNARSVLRVWVDARFALRSCCAKRRVGAADGFRTTLVALFLWLQLGTSDRLILLKSWGKCAIVIAEHGLLWSFQAIMKYGLSSII